jgi:molybdate-binding protein/DNA-binding XRE family transcriptional regulator
MADERTRLENSVRDRRARRGWSQDELARRAGLSRAGVSAIETGRLVPSAAAALALAAAFGARVEDLFSLPKSAPAPPAWAWPAGGAPAGAPGAGRYWRAEVAGRTWLYPVEPTMLGAAPHDGVAPDGVELAAGLDAANTLVMACCDPAVGLLAGALARSAGVRLLAFTRPSRSALDLLRRGLVHVAGVHLAAEHDRDDDGNASAVREALGRSGLLLRVARWEEGVAYAPGRRLASPGQAARAPLRWVGREAGSGARQCLDDLLGGRRAPRRLARDHRAVAEAVRAGWADAGVCLRLAGEEAGLDFLPLRREAYDLCFPAELADDPRLRALVAAVRSHSYRRLLGELPGYDGRETGALRKAGT